MIFEGSITALITPLANGKLDEKAFAKIVEHQISSGTNGVVPCGTTGESPTLTHDEHNHVISLCIDACKGRIPVLAGTGSNSTEEAIMMTRHAEKAGATGALIVSPYYNKPTQEGLFQHFKAIHDATSLPLIIYNIPGRSVVDISDATLARLAELPRIAGLKDATGDLMRPFNLGRLLGKNASRFVQLSGEDATALAFNAQGGRGCISVTSNIAPKLCAEFHTAWKKADYAKALEVHTTLMPVHKAMFAETSPGPVKYAAELLGLCSAEMRLPMVPIAESSRLAVKEALTGAGLL